MSHRNSSVAAPINNQTLFIGFAAEAMTTEELAPLNMTVEQLSEQIERGWAAIKEQGVEGALCGISRDPDETETQLRTRFAEQPYGVALIGGGVRMLPENTVLLERVVNVLIDLQPGIRISFNTSPQNAYDAIQRWITR
ncbi:MULTISPECIES: hypothetical protein [unclassified Curtobacterium]|uniref:hypothetical protein n=1 Tax=unclassified Curtobacterium TaxID=257496 RepID=UPI000DA73E3A|nr:MULTISPECIES: hypothetical protein [unclassified Curtobacterium]PZE66168.1 hypothetical protein DEJ12_13935 [Curtobacterium sp. MCLR17_059]PZF53975.1 hypothetical protein DEJ10_04555 [Curtobacterium sp. MCLR17_057]